MRYVPKSQGTPVFVYELPYGVFEEYAYENRDYYGDDPDWKQVKEDYMAILNVNQYINILLKEN